MSKFDKRHTRIDFKTVINQEGIRGSRTVPKQDSTKAFVRRRGLPHDEDPADPTRSQNGLQLDNANANHISPWTNYEESYELRLGVDNRVVVAVQKDFPFDEVTVRKFSVSKVPGRLRLFKQDRHGNVVNILDTFRFEEMIYVIYEHMPLSLHHIANSPLLDEIRLAAILGQVLNGLASLFALGLEHRLLISSNVLDGAIGVDDPSRWSPDAIGFLSKTTSAASVKELIKHTLLRLPWKREMLKILVSFAMVSVRRGYKYPPS
ncbi:hypothetical protein K432DRAFT_398460 [Lepidopterella palustris CBS 459.81]|uniref:Protein kinase domain-containing protein n=1 Tax=Lepidopterella palustris CBS 459.81 TaxID=1314670 RepID=A0A8E2DYA6_9PEZI|nr:hypothetical protein K432DRAFT_398460 [Lepidopterella palustris CBS 459.81]